MPGSNRPEPSHPLDTVRDMRESSREPTLSDSTRWLGITPEPEVAHDWDGLPQVLADLGDAARTRFFIQSRYLQSIGVAVTRSVAERMIAEAIDWGERNDFRLNPQPYTVSTVYYLRVGSLIKIGQTVNLSVRLRSYPPDAVLLAFEIGPRDDLEAERHDQFQAARLSPQRREWFHPSAALIEHINSLREQPLTPAELAA